MKPIVEICCGSYEDTLAAARGGAERIELNSALFLGGLTPSYGTLRQVKRHTNLKVIAMVRPRGAGFCYSAEEVETMLLDAELLLSEGADGIAFGFLDSQGAIAVEKTKRMTELIKRYGGEAVFHRAFDCVQDPNVSIKQLIAVGIDRILTSGLKAKAENGIPQIRELQQKYGNEIEILAGSGVHAGNAKKIIEETGIWQVHSSCKGWKLDETTEGTEVSYAYAANPHEKEYDIVDENLVRKIVEAVTR